MPSTRGPLPDGNCTSRTPVAVASPIASWSSSSFSAVSPVVTLVSILNPPGGNSASGAPRYHAASAASEGADICRWPEAKGCDEKLPVPSKEKVNGADVSDVLRAALRLAKRASGSSHTKAQPTASPPMTAANCALSRPPKEGHLRVPEIPATSTPSPVAARRSTTRKRPFSIVISPKGASSRGMALPGGTSQSGFCQLTAPSAPRSSVMTGSTSVISSRACSPRSAESRLNEAVMRPISASRSGSGPVETIVVAGSVTRGSGQNRTSGSPLIVLFPPDQSSSIRSIVARASVVETTSGSAALYAAARAMPMAADQTRWRRRSRAHRRESRNIWNIFLVIRSDLPSPRVSRLDRTSACIKQMPLT